MPDHLFPIIKIFQISSAKFILKGEAYFEVTPDSLKPFVVKSESLNVKVLGTTFNVRTYEDENLVNVVLRTGRVDVSLNGSNQKVIELQPNEKLSYNKVNKELEKIPVNADDVCEWVNGKMKFYKSTIWHIGERFRKEDIM